VSVTTFQFDPSAATWRRQVKVPQAMWRRSSSPIRRISSCMPGSTPRPVQIRFHEWYPVSASVPSATWLYVTEARTWFAGDGSPASDLRATGSAS
jgi:hypothetical protein